MSYFRNLPNLVEELKRRKESARDYIVGMDQLVIQAQAKELLVTNVEREPVLSHRAIGQLAERMAPPMPTAYARKLVDSQLFAEVAGVTLPASKKNVMLRCLDGGVRAVLSDKYRAIDNYDLAFFALDAVQQAKGEVLKCSLSDDRLHLAFTSRECWEKIYDTAQRADTGSHEFLRLLGQRAGGRDEDGGIRLHPYCVVSNSEVGTGALSVSLGFLNSVCVNGALVDQQVSQIHVGSKLEEGIYTAETRETHDKALMLKCRDAIHAALHPNTLVKMVKQLEGSQAKTIGQPVDAVNHLIVTQSSLREEDRDELLTYFMRDYDHTAYGLSQAVARLAQDVDDDRHFEIEALAGSLATGRLTPAMAAVSA